MIDGRRQNERKRVRRNSVTSCRLRRRRNGCHVVPLSRVWICPSHQHTGCFPCPPSTFLSSPRPTRAPTSVLLARLSPAAAESGQVFMSDWGHIVSQLGLVPKGHPLDLANASLGEKAPSVQRTWMYGKNRKQLRCGGSSDAVAVASCPAALSS